MKKELLMTVLCIFGGYLIWRKLEKNEKTEEKEPQITPNPEKNEVKVENKKPNVVEKDIYSIDKDKYTCPEDLTRVLMETIIQAEDFTSQVNFFEKLIYGCGRNCPDFSWYENFPRSVEEAEDKLKEFGLYAKYERVLCKIYTGKYPEE